MHKLCLLFQTVRYLKPIQLISRIKRRFKKIKFKTPSTIKLNNYKAPWIREELICSSYRRKDIFCFLNQEGNIGTWNNFDQSKLWLYNLHYFDDLNSFEANKRTDFHYGLIERWIDENPPIFGNGWEPYPQSLRIVNWIKYFLSFELPSESVLISLSLQSQILSQDLEYHLLGNHLFANAKAMVFAGCYFKGDESEGWLELGLKVLDQQIPEQILKDGGHFELSPMYHNIILADMLDLYNLAQSYQIYELSQRQNKWKLIIENMLQWARKMEHPDGEVSFFNDSAIGIAPCTGKLFEYAKKLGIKENSSLSNIILKKLDYTYLKDSGYIIVESDKIKAILDVAKIGPDYIPGHGHADTLSFELSLFGQRIFVNSGTGEYGLSEERLRQRKTAAHNTVEVDGEDSSEVWSGFRVARRAYPSQPVINQSEESILISCSHNGYQRLSGRVTHQRLYKFDDENLVITDFLSGRYKFAKCYFHIHPDVEVKNINGVITLTLLNGNKLIILSNQSISIEDSTWHPKFGVSIKNKKLVINMHTEESILTIKY
ncbi:heparinase II/III family protein [Photobacterium leiognathi]|uniref:heparinase II/III family protein n=1 Tax=Photobacterium leiognathi TaxID=553611 RepID=UPI0027375334|nr:alginate lyase family protein [Photobacterium leiognathi]